MFCPRCGRPVSEAANFCGGCGLPRADIEQYYKNKQVADMAGNAQQATQQNRQGYGTETYPDSVQEKIESGNEWNSTADNSHIYTATDTSSDSWAQAEYNNSNYGSGYHNEGFVNSIRAKNENLTTVDYVWMMILSSIPIFGLMYLVYWAFFNSENVNKRSFARAVLILCGFSFLLAIAFSIGLFMA